MSDSEKLTRVFSRTPSSWDPQDDLLLRHLKEQQKLGWKEISSHFAHRTPNACQFRWRRLKSGNLKGSTTESSPVIASPISSNTKEKNSISSLNSLNNANMIKNSFPPLVSKFSSNDTPKFNSTTNSSIMNEHINDDLSDNNDLMNNYNQSNINHSNSINNLNQRSDSNNSNNSNNNSISNSISNSNNIQQSNINNNISQTKDFSNGHSNINSNSNSPINQSNSSTSLNYQINSKPPQNYTAPTYNKWTFQQSSPSNHNHNHNHSHNISNNNNNSINTSTKTITSYESNEPIENSKLPFSTFTNTNHQLNNQTINVNQSIAWSMDEDELLINRRKRELSFAELSILLPTRTEGEIWHRIDHLERNEELNGLTRTLSSSSQISMNSTNSISSNNNQYLDTRSRSITSYMGNYSNSITPVTDRYTNIQINNLSSSNLVNLMDSNSPIGSLPTKNIISGNGYVKDKDVDEKLPPLESLLNKSYYSK